MKLMDRFALGDSLFSYSNLLVFTWAGMPESRVPAYPVVESLDVLEDRYPQWVTGRRYLNTEELKEWHSKGKTGKVVIRAKRQRTDFPFGGNYRKFGA